MNQLPYIICIDDESFILWNLREQLRTNFGGAFNIEIAENAEIAEALIAELISEGEEIQVVICDHFMPVKTGVEFLIELHQTNPEIKKIMLTGQADVEAVGKAINHGCLYRFISKPWHAKDLEITIGEASRSFESGKAIVEKNKKLEQLLYYNPESNFPNLQSLNRDISEFESAGILHCISILKFVSSSKITEAFGVELYRKLPNYCLQLLTKMTNDNFKIYHLSEDEIAILTNLPEDELLKDLKLIRMMIKADDFKIGSVNFNLDMVYSLGSGKIDVLDKARVALHSIPTASQINIRVYDEEISENKHLKNLMLSEKLTSAILTKNIVPFFQGIRDNQKNVITKFECLARLKDGSEFISPYLFLDLAKTTGMIRMVGMQMIDYSFQYFKDNEFEFSLNLTEAELEYNSFVKWIEIQLTKYKINPARVTFEILEDINFANNKDIISSIRNLKSIGCQIAIDDFGVQHSNLARLLEIDPDYIKIDGQFIKELPSNKTACLLVKGIVNLAHEIGAKVVAEFVSSKDIQDVVLDLGIEYSQGYLFGQPKEII